MTTSNLPTTIRTLIQPDPKSEHIILTTIPLPIQAPNTTEHLLRVHAVAITNNELTWPANFPASRPIPYSDTQALVPLYDVAGTIVTAPEDSPFKAGDEVWALGVEAGEMKWAEAATVPMSAQTAWQALFVHGGLKAEAGVGGKGKRVFVTAASGAVGSWVVQLAVWSGAEVVGTASAANAEFVKSLGVTEVLDYRSADVKAWAEEEGVKADLVIDCIGGKSLEEAWWVVKEGGTLISVFQPPVQKKPERLEGKKVRNEFFVMEPDGEQLGEVTRLVDEGRFVPVLDSVWPLEKFEEAFAKAESGKTRGKVVFELYV
ncbi:related to zinc-binding oxidoreductase [Phialocephala subalpina]|uniref:Related to zinc-binding oxidoreductase n=1 Tax=Phialocephala subalpina TaxID=576137 RepID=A0A1L7X9K0_9HELO|nr:related to zinc-binding oxidoreductase [Phialocephala subalpina]